MKKNDKKKSTPTPTPSKGQKKSTPTPTSSQPSKLHDILIICLLVFIIIISIVFTYLEITSTNLFWKIQGYRSLIGMPFFLIIMGALIYMEIKRIKKN
jgi:hypothetical protein